MKVNQRHPHAVRSATTGAATATARKLAPTSPTAGWTAGARAHPHRPAPATAAPAQVPGSAAAKQKLPLWVPPTAGQWTVDKHGVRSDPVNIYAHGTLNQLETALGQAGWTKAAENNGANNKAFLEGALGYEATLAEQALENEAAKLLHHGAGPANARPTPNRFAATVASMPVSQQTLDGTPNLSSWECHNDPLHGRDHLRIFDTGKVDAAGQHIWAIAASRDTGIKLDAHRPEQGFLNHAVEANTDGERSLVVQNLEATGRLAFSRSFPLAYGSSAAPATGAMPHDGRAYDLVLK